MRVDGQDRPTFPEGVSPTGTFGPDGKRVAYYAFRSKKVLLVVDDWTKETTYDDVIWENGAFRDSGIFRGIGITKDEIHAFTFAP
jgi:hypothetical protein